MMMRYSMLIQWSDEDNAYLVTLPEWNPMPVVDGASYEEAARQGGKKCWNTLSR